MIKLHDQPNDELEIDATGKRYGEIRIKTDQGRLTIALWNGEIRVETRGQLHIVPWMSNCIKLEIKE
jgi:hypothetical protein